MPQEFEYFPLYVHKLLSSLDVRKMDATAFGGYMLLLIESFISNPQGYLPDVSEELRFIARMSTEEWEKYGEKLTSKFKKRRGNLIYNPKMLSVIQDLRKRRDKRVSAGRVGASKRWEGEEKSKQSHSNAIEKPSTCYSNKIEQNRIEENQTKQKRKKPSAYSSEFDIFWAEYPHGDNRSSKDQTFRNWKSLLKEGINIETLLQCGENYAEHVRLAETERKFIYKASNFLGRDRYFEEFDPETWKPPEKEETIYDIAERVERKHAAETKELH